MPGRKMGLPLEDRKAVMDEAMRMMAKGKKKQKILNYCHENGCDWTWNYLRGEASTRDVRRPKEAKVAVLPPLEPYIHDGEVKIRDVVDREKAVYMSDIHYPFQHPKALAAVRRFMLDFQPQRIFILGDLLDCYSVSRFDKNPLRGFLLKDEIQGVVGLLAELRNSFPNAVIHYNLGNHEWRFVTETIQKAPAFAGLEGHSLHSLLHLKEFDISATTWGGRFDYLGFKVTHGNVVRKHSAYSAREQQVSLGGSLVMGHTHRRGSHSFTNAAGSHTSYELGCLCDLSPDYIRESPPNWQLGIGYSYVFDKAVHFTPVPIYEGKGFSIQGEYYRL